MLNRLDVHPTNRTALKFRSILVAFGLAMCFVTGTAVAQILYGTLTGNVTDPSGAVVPNVKVEALATSTGVSHTTTTDSNGVYRFADLPEGSYKVTISAQGFNTVVLQNIAITVNNITRADSQLGVAQAQTVVEVNAQQQLLQTDKADVHTDLSTQDRSHSMLVPRWHGC